jgi:mono/diheme cytochrome c family protein
LEGQPDWKIRQEDGSYPAPPHDSTGHTWHHPDEQLLEIIARGGDPALGSKMPGFENTLSADQMQAILAFIKSHWGDEERAFQWWITAR